MYLNYLRISYKINHLYSLQAARSIFDSSIITNFDSSSMSPTSQSRIYLRPLNCHSVERPSKATTIWSTPFLSTTSSDRASATKPNRFSCSSTPNAFALHPRTRSNSMCNQPSNDGPKNRPRITDCSCKLLWAKTTNRPNIDTFGCVVVWRRRRPTGRNISHSFSRTPMTNDKRTDPSKKR